MVNSARKCSSSVPPPPAGCVSSLSTGGRSLSASLLNLAASASCNERAAGDFNADAPSEHADEASRVQLRPAEISVHPIHSAIMAPEEFPMPNKNDFEKVFARLKSVLKPYAKKMDVAHDNEMYYLLNTHYRMKNKKPLCFGGVRCNLKDKLAVFPHSCFQL